MPKIAPCLWFDTQSEEAANFYVSVFPNSQITSVSYYSEQHAAEMNKHFPRQAGMVLTVNFVLDAQPFMALNGGPQFKFSQALSFTVPCADQDEIDYYWDKLSEGGEEGACGWLQDRFGLSWQVVPNDMAEMITGTDQVRRDRVMQVVMNSKKFDLAALRAAAAGS